MCLYIAQTLELMVQITAAAFTESCYSSTNIKACHCKHVNIDLLFLSAQKIIVCARERKGEGGRRDVYKRQVLDIV